jgi:F-type H+-transporting ATPase subunit epsilon
MKLQFLSPSKTIFDGEVESVTIPGSKGLFTVLDSHAPLLTTMNKGIVVFRTKDTNTREISVTGGFAEVKDNVITICTEKVVESEDKK